MKAKFKLLNKWYKDSWFFGRSYYATLRLIDEEFRGPSIIDNVPITACAYYGADIGDTVSLPMSKKENGKWGLD